VLVLHPWWGLSSAVRAACDRLAGQGYVAYAPDLYHGRLVTTIDEAQAMVDNLDQAAAASDIAKATDLLGERSQSRAKGLGVVGFSLGASFALRLSAGDPDRIKAVTLFYGTGDGEFEKAGAAYLGHFAEHDPYEPADAVNWLEGALKSAGRPATFHRYPGVGHWFCEADRPDAYNQPAAELAWSRTIEFFDQTLK
jgi:carboxymethylenebutenolidase